MTRPRGGSIERLREILDQVVDVFEADRKPHHPLADAKMGALLRLQALVGRRRGMGQQALGVAEIVGNADDRERVGHCERAGLAALDLEGDERAAAVICRLASAAWG